MGNGLADFSLALRRDGAVRTVLLIALGASAVSSIAFIVSASQYPGSTPGLVESAFVAVVLGTASSLWFTFLFWWIRGVVRRGRG